MKSKTIIRNFIAVLFLILTLYPYNITNTQEIIMPSVQENSSITKANNLVWKYKIINGKLYRRLYDQTQRKWIGDWELVP